MSTLLLKQIGLVLSAGTIVSLLGLRIGLAAHNQKALKEMGSNQDEFAQFFKKVHKETPYLIFVTSGYRSNEKQKRLHAQNPKNAKPGRSPHQAKRAMDINLISLKGFIRKADSKETWEATGVPQIADEMGFRWGGNFRNYHDPVHFDLPKSGLD